MVGDVGHEVGVAAVGLAHHAVLVVAVVGRAQPERAVLLVGLAGLDQLVDRLLDPAAGVEAGFEVVMIELDLERLQVQILLVAQIGDRELAHAIEVVDIAAGGELAVVGLDGLPG